eukprot:2949707-Amphidinium_carterae.3
MAQQLMLWINQATTFDKVHQWISNYFNSTYAGVEDEKGTVGAINDAEDKQYDEWNEDTEEYDYEYNEDDVKYMVAMLNKGKGTSHLLYMWQASPHIAVDSPNCPSYKGSKGNKGQKGQRAYYGQWNDGKGYQQPQQHAYEQSGYSGYSGQPLHTGQPHASAHNPKGKGYGKQPWHNFGKGKKGQLPINNIGD